MRFGELRFGSMGSMSAEVTEVLWKEHGTLGVAGSPPKVAGTPWKQQGYPGSNRNLLEVGGTP